MIKIHMGCGRRDFGKEWIHIDQEKYDHVMHNDITKLVFQSGTVDLIYASHVLSYFNRREALFVLLEWNRVLKPGGVIRLAVPDFQAMARLYTMAPDTFPIESFLGPIYGQMAFGSTTIYHKTTYDYRSLSVLLQEAGFKHVGLYDWRHTEHAHIDDHSQAYLPHMAKEKGNLISLNVEAVK
jgi:predicted SAM-dependent methyltransferase